MTPVPPTKHFEKYAPTADFAACPGTPQSRDGYHLRTTHYLQLQAMLGLFLLGMRIRLSRNDGGLSRPGNGRLPGLFEFSERHLSHP